MKRHWLNRERLALYAAAFVVLYLAIGALLLKQCPSGVTNQGVPLTPDFIVYWGASHLAVSGDPAAAYDNEAIIGAERIAMPAAVNSRNSWYYPPTFFLVVLPLSLLSYLPSYLLFMSVTFAGYVFVLRQICLTQGLPLSGLWWPLLGFPAVFLNLLQGQNGFLTAGLAGGALLMLRSRPLWAGVLIGLLTIKPQLGPLFPLILVCSRQWRALFAASVTVLMFMTAAIGVLGIDTLHAFLEKVPHVGGAIGGDSLLLVREMPSFYSFCRLLGLPPAAAYTLHGAVALTVAATVAWIWVKCRDESLRTAAFAAGTLLISPYLFDYDLSWLALALIWFVGHAMREGWLRGERETLVVVWLLPVLWMPARYFTSLQLAPLVLLAFFVLIVRRSLIQMRNADAAKKVAPAVT
ncbi:MAG: hypothetical protein JWR07_1582 [Nevskia sp.]|nr:hypothetical protein [Nevskia sp.]